MEKESLVWNPIKNKLTPWIDVNKIKIMFEKTMKENNSNRARRGYGRSVSQDDSGDNRVRSGAERSGGMAASMQAGAGKPDFNASVSGLNRSATTAPGRGFNRSATMGPRHGPAHGLNKSATMGPSRATVDPSAKPEIKMSRPTSNGFLPTMDKDTEPKAKDLKEYMQQWSHKAPDYKKLKPLEDLLVNVPDLFPPTNKFVESHEYYFKWKEFSEDAFSGESGDELKELLRRASRKSKLFLHPDKLPGNLTENQDELFKTIWNVIQESEAATLQ